MPRRADTPRHRFGTVVARNKRRHEVRLLHPGECRSKCFGTGPLAVEDFGPEPLGTVRAATLGEITRAASPGPVGDFGRLGMGSMVFPEPSVSGQIAGELWMHRQRPPLTIDRQRRGAGGIDADADHAVRSETRQLFRRLHRSADRLHEALDIVGRVLPGEVGIGGSEEDPLLAAGVGVDVAGQLAAVCHIDHQCPHAVGPEVNADRVLLRTRFCHSSSFAVAGMVRISQFATPS